MFGIEFVFFFIVLGPVVVVEKYMSWFYSVHRHTSKF